jgi:hypothetical protein
MQKKNLYIITALLVIVLIFSMGALCTFCGKELLLTDTTISSSKPDSSNGNISQNYTTTIAAPENTLSEQEKLKAAEDKAKAFETGEDTGSSSQAVTETSALKDNRFVIMIETMQHKDQEYSYAKGNDPDFYEMTDYFLSLGIPQEQIHIYYGQDQDGGTYDNFVKAVNDVKIISNTGSAVLVALMSHGNPEAEFGADAMMEFADGMGNEHGGRYISYYDICSLLDQIPCGKMAVTISSCAMEDSAIPVAKKTAYPRAAIAPITFQEILNYILTDKSAVDRDKDGRYSLKDVLEFVKDPTATKNPARYFGVELVDPANIAGSFYLN